MLLARMFFSLVTTAGVFFSFLDLFHCIMNVDIVNTFEMATVELFCLKITVTQVARQMLEAG